MVTSRKADEIVAAEKVISANLVWKPSSPCYRLEATVLLVGSDEVCRLLGNMCRVNRSFVLLFGGIPIRKWTVHSQHRNPDGEIIRSPHKHGWDDVVGDRNVYIPDDIRVGDVNDEFHDFLRESNIILRGSYTTFKGFDEPQVQVGMDI